MRPNKWKRSIGLFMYDRQGIGTKFLAMKKSFQEVSRILQGERKK